MDLSTQSKLLCGILLITVPSIQYGGYYLLQLLTAHDKTYIDNPFARGSFVPVTLMRVSW